MKLLTFRRADCAPEPGALLPNGDIASLMGAGFPDLLSVIQGGAEARAKIEKFLEHPPVNCVAPQAAATIVAPIARPPKIICVGLNYRDHAIESNMEIPSVPTIFNKFNTAVIGPGEKIVLPKSSTKPDYEAE